MRDPYGVKRGGHSLVDDGSKMVATYTYFCGYYTLVPDRKDISGFFPWE